MQSLFAHVAKSLQVFIKQGIVSRALLARTMATANDKETVLTPLRLAVREQGDIVRDLKSQGKPQLEVQEALKELKKRKKLLENKEKEFVLPDEKFDRSALEDLVKRRFYYGPSFSIYGGYAGLYDFGPMGCAMKANFLSSWRQHFVLEENMLEVDTTILTPEPILRTSGHVEKFSDFMVKDKSTGDCYRADHLLTQNLEKFAADPKCSEEKKTEYESVVRQADNYSKEEMGELFVKYKIKAPLTGNPLSAPVEFNLMFSTGIGPGNGIPGFLRPETAQGIFVNFKRLLEFNNGRLPFAGAQIGKAFRNEISPRSGLIRVREFEMAEIEHFVNPDKKNDFPKFDKISSLVLNLYSACDQMDGKPVQPVTLEKAVSTGMIANKTLGYFIGRIHQFLMKMGVDNDKLRFRQHMSNEMAHYACDCWDAECKTSYGWIECVGCADRSCFDLTRHSKVTKVDLSAKVDLPEPIVVDCVEVFTEKGIIGKQFRKDSKTITDTLNNLTEEQITEMETTLTNSGKFSLSVGDKLYDLTPDMLSVRRFKKTLHVADVIPGVIEPSFGIGRILYSILEHNFKIREDDEKRNWLSLPPGIAPISCSVLPLSGDPRFDQHIETIVTGLKISGVSHKVDDSSGSIGRRYSRTDEIGIPFGITVDFDSLKDGSATLRERNSMQQIRTQISDLPELVYRLVRGLITWKDILEKYPLFTGQESTR